MANLLGRPRQYGALLERRIFGPLGMKDTSFFVPQDKRGRRANAYGFDDQGRLVKRTTWGGAWGDVVVSERPQDMAYESGSGGLWSTVEDYVKFARLFLGDGSVDGVRLLRIRFLAHNMVDLAQMAKGMGLGVWAAIEQFQTTAMA